MKKFIILLLATYQLTSCNEEKKTAENKDQTKDTIYKRIENPYWLDSTYTSVKLPNTFKVKKVVMVQIEQKATIYVNEKLIRQRAVDKQNDFNRKEYSEIIRIIDSMSLTNDTIIIDQYLDHLEYLISEQLQNGNAKVYYKKLKAFVPIIFHRQERYGSNAHRFFYLPDQRPFFSAWELTGILDHDNPFGRSDPKEIEKMGEKLAEINKE